MQKKVLLPLIMVTPGLSALAINVSDAVPAADWTASAISSDFKVDGDKVTASIANGVISQSVKGLPYGKYILSGTFNNCKVSVNGKEVAIEDGKVAFTIDGTSLDNTVEFKVESADGLTGFNFSGLVLTLDENFDTEINAILARIAAEDLANVEVVTDDAALEKSLKAQLAALVKTQTDLTKKYTDMLGVITPADDTITIANLVKFYKDYVNDNAVADADVVKFEADVKALLEAIDKAKTEYETKQANKALMDAMLADVTDLRAQLEAFKAEVKEGTYDWAKDKSNAEITTFAGKLDDYEQKIKDAYTNLLEPDDIDNEKEALQAELDQLKAQYAIYVADCQALDALKALKHTLTSTYADAQSDISKEIKGIEGYEKVYDTLKQEWLNTVGGLYSTGVEAAMEKIDGKDVDVVEQEMPEGLSGNKGKAITTAYNDAIAAINALLAEKKQVVDDNNAAMTAALAVVDAYEARIKAATTETVPSSLKEDYDAALAAAQAAVAALKTTIETAYSDVALDEAAYAEDNATAEAKVKALEDIVAAFQPIVDLQKALDAAKKQIAEDNAKITDFDIDLPAKFQETYDNIQAAINKLEIPADADDVASIKKAIETLVKDGNNLYKAFTSVWENIGKFGTAVNDLKTEIDTKDGRIVTGTDGKLCYDLPAFTNDVYKPLKTQYDTWVADIKAAAKISDPVACFDAATTVQSEVNDGTTGFKQLRAQAWTAYLEVAKDVTNDNLNAITAVIAALKVELADATKYPAGSTVSFTDIDKTLAAITTAVNKANTEAGKVDAASKAQTSVAKLFNTEDPKMMTLQTTVNNIKTQMAAYAALLPLEDDVQDAIDAATKLNNETSFGDGKTHFEEVIAGIQKQLDDKKAAIDKALKDLTVAKNQTTYKNDLAAIKKLAVNALTDIATNNNSYAQELTEGASVRAQVQEIYEAVCALDPAVEGVTDWKTALETLMETEITNIDKNVNKVYGEGKCNAATDGNIPAYQAALAKAQEIMGAADANYDANLAKYNNDYANTAWASLINGLNSAYQHVIGNYNSYLYDITNPGYVAYLRTTLDDYYRLYGYSNDINALVQQKCDYVKECTGQKIVITDEMWAENVADLAEALTNAIDADGEGLDATIAQKAEAYYGLRSGEARTAIDDANNALDAAGIPTDYTAPAEDALEAAVKDYDAAKADTKINFGLAMDGIAYKLDKVFDEIDLNKFAQEEWAKVYGEAEDTIADLRKAIDDCTTLGDKKDQYLENFDAIVEQAADLNSDVVANENEIDSYAADKANLDNLLAQLEAIKTAAVDEEAANVAEKLAQTDYTGYLNDFEDEYAKLVAFNATTSVSNDRIVVLNIENVARYINNYRTSLDRYVAAGTVAQNTGSLDNRKAQVESYFSRAYYNIEAAQHKLVSTWVDNAKESYNNAIDGGKTAEELIDFNDKINAAIEGADELKAVWYGKNPTVGFELDQEYSDKAEDLLKTLTGIYVDLQQYWPDGVTGMYVADYLAALDEFYTNLTNTITDEETALAADEEQVKEAYAGEFEKLQAELDAIKAAYEAEGSKILANSANYETQMAAIQAQVEALAAQVAADQAKWAANNAAYATLADAIKALKDRYAEVEAVIAGFGSDYEMAFAPSMEGVMNDITFAEEHINVLNKVGMLDENSVVPNEAQIYADLASYEFEATWYYADGKRSQTYTVSRSVNTLINNSHLINAAELNSRWSALNTRYNDNRRLTPAYGDVSAENLATLNTVITEYEALIEAFNQLLEEVKDNTFTPGDVNLNPDGAVTAVDIQMIANWIGEGVTYDDLLAQNKRQAYAADITEDKAINVGDLTAAVNLFLGRSVGQVNVAAKSAAKHIGNDSNIYDLKYVGEFDGADRYAVILNNSTAFAAGQFDINLKSGSNLVRVVAAERTEGHQVAVYDNSLEEVRVVMFSMDNALMSGNTGAIAYLDVQGSAPVVKDVVCSTADSNVVEVVGAPGQSMLDSVVDGAKNAIDAVYDAAGRAYRSIQRGINIIRHSDGSVTKEYHNK